jgi:hypothetical protein
MQPGSISHRHRSAVIATGAAALALALGGAAADARPDTAPVIGEHANNQGTQPLPQVVDPPSDRLATAAGAPSPAPSVSASSAADDGGVDGGLIAGLSLATVALLGSGTYVARRRRHVAPGH